MFGVYWYHRREEHQQRLDNMLMWWLDIFLDLLYPKSVLWSSSYQLESILLRIRHQLWTLNRDWIRFSWICSTDWIYRHQNHQSRRLRMIRRLSKDLHRSVPLKRNWNRQWLFQSHCFNLTSYSSLAMLVFEDQWTISGRTARDVPKIEWLKAPDGKWSDSVPVDHSDRSVWVLKTKKTCSRCNEVWTVHSIATEPLYETTCLNPYTSPLWLTPSTVLHIQYQKLDLTQLAPHATRYGTNTIIQCKICCRERSLWGSELSDLFLSESGCIKQPAIWLQSTISSHLSGIDEKVGISAQFKVSSTQLTTIELVSNTGNSMKSSRSTDGAVLLLLSGQKCTRTTSTWALILTWLQDQIECRFKWSLVQKPAFCHVEWPVVWDHPWPI